MDLSIIVPVFNVEKYIKQCIDSLVKIKGVKYEIIIVNDGTNDKSMDIVKEYKNYNLRIINQSNKGLSAARNIGIDNSHGKYIMFVDGDDFLINQEKVSFLVKSFNENTEMIIVNYNLYWNDNNFKKALNMEKISSKNNYSGTQYLSCAIDNDIYEDAACFKIYKKDFIIKNNLKFKEGFYHEDVDWSMRCFLKSKELIVCDEVFYMYRQRESSITKLNNINSVIKKAKDITLIIKGLDLYVEAIKDIKLKKKIVKWQGSRYITAIEMLYRFNIKNKEICDYNYILNKKIGLRNILKLTLLRLNIFSTIKNIYKH